MDNTSYSKKTISHFMKPKNMGDIEGADGVGKVTNPSCGDIMKIFLKVKEENGEKIIEDIKFRTLGCAAAISTSDMICELAKGKPVKEALKITYDDISEELGDLPPIKKHWGQLAEQTLKAAVEDLKDKK
ncbi:MAG: iron-sulfur cluster assembly scaffold protein [Minisyncoccales bacterium]